MLHAWGRFGLDAAGDEHFCRYRGRDMTKGPHDAGRAFRNVVYGHLSFVKMVCGTSDPVFLKLCSRVLELDPNPSKFIRQMVYGAIRAGALRGAKFFAVLPHLMICGTSPPNRG